MIELSLLKDILLVVSILLNILLFFRHPFQYLRERYRGALKRKADFYDPLMEDLRRLSKDLKKINFYQRVSGLEEKHLTLIISNKAKAWMNKLMGGLEEFNNVLRDIEYYIYPYMLNKFANDLKEIEGKYWTGLCTPKSSESTEFFDRVKRNSALKHFLACGCLDKKVDLASFPAFQDIVSSIERAHINRELEAILGRICEYVVSTYTFERIRALREDLLKLLENTLTELKKDAHKLSSRFYGTVYGAGSIELIEDYKGKKSKARERERIY